MKRLSNAAAAVVAFCALDASLWGLSVAFSLVGDEADALVASWGAILGKLPIAVAWLVWVWQTSTELKLREPGSVDPLIAVCAFVVPLVRWVAPVWVMWRFAAALRPSLRWLVPIWFLTWVASRLSMHTGELGMDALLGGLSVLGCGIAGGLVNGLDRARPGASPADSPDG